MTAHTVEHANGVLTITLTHPERGNALTGDDARSLADLLDETSLETPEVRAVLLRAAGRHFCTGADVSGQRTADGSHSVTGHMVRSLARSHHRAISSVFHCRVPVVAAVRGAAQGFGLHLALAADFVVASAQASFKDPFADRGFNVDSGGSWLLPRLVGLTRAKQLLYFAETLDAETALAWGMVHSVVAHDDLDGAARDLASRLAGRPTQAIAATKRLLHDAAESDLDAAMHAESMAVELTIRGRDFKEGMRAFFEKRSPTFDGT